MDSLESNVFINEDDFLKKINCFNLNLIEVDSYNDLDIILSMSVDSFLTFAHKKQLDIFYQFNYLDETDYLITGSTVIDSIPSVLFSSHQIHSDFPAYLNSLLSPDNSLSVPDDFQKSFATVYKGNIIKNLIMDCQSYTKYRPNETTGGIFVSWQRKEELPTGA